MSPDPNTQSSDAVALELERAMLDFIARDAVKIPPYPAVALRLDALVQKNDFGLNEVSALVTSDQALAADVLRCANSTFYRRGNEVVSVQQAITRIGAREVTRVALASALGAQARAGPLQSLKRYIWQEALGSAILAQQLARNRKLSAESGFACGLLHDFGRMVAAAALEELLSRGGHTVGRPEGFWATLIERFHVELGEQVAQKWKLPALIADVIAHHHEGEGDPANLEMISVIRAVDRVMHELAVRVHLCAKDLAAVPELRDDPERELVARALPSLPGFIASFEAPDSGKPSRSVPPSKWLAPEPAVLAGTAPFDQEVLAHFGKEVEKFKGVSIEARHLVMRGPNPLRENYLIQLTLQLKPPFSIWGVPKSCRPEGSGFVVEVRPYALSDEALQRWSALVAPPAPP
jgi:putative nucleotidyltransferase with HDIG domain